MVKYRAKHGYTQRALAAEWIVSQATIGHWETGHKTPGLRTAFEIAERIGIPQRKFTFEYFYGPAP